MDELVTIYSTSDDIEAQMISNLLSENGILSIKQDSGSGQYVRAYIGNSMYGKDILIHQKDYNKAVLILQSLENTNLAEDEIPDELKEDIEDKKEQLDRSIKETKKAKLWFRFVLIGFILIIPIVLILVNVFK